MSRARSAALSVTVGALVFVALSWICNNEVYGAMVGLLGYSAASGPSIGLFCAVIAILCGTSLGLLTAGRLPRWLAVADLALYGCCLLAVALFKSVGVREVNLDVGELLAQASDNPWILWLNVLGFVPAGALLRHAAPSYARSFATLLGLSLGLEVAQYVLGLGVADVLDVIANTLGGIAGFAAADIVVMRGYRIACREGSLVVVHDAPEPRRREFVSPLVLASALLSCVVLAVTAAISPVRATGEPFVEELSAQELAWMGDSAPRPLDAGFSDDLWLDGDGGARQSPFSIDGSTLVVEGTMIQADEWVSEEGAHYCGVAVSNDSRLGEGLETLSVPVVATENTRFLLWGKPVDMTAAVESFATVGPRQVTARLVGHNGWLEASEIDLGDLAAPAPESPGATFNWGVYGDLLANAGRGVWEASGDGAAHLRGYVHCTASLDELGERRYATLACPRLVAGVPVLRSLNVWLDGDPDSGSWGWCGDLRDFTLARDGGRFVLTER